MLVMDVILVNCKYAGSDVAGSCKCESRRRDKKFLGLISLGTEIPPCVETCCKGVCNWKEPLEEEKKVKKERKPRVSKKKVAESAAAE
jgi:hypothetical protein